MLSHDNLTWENKPLMEELKLFAPDIPPQEHRFVSYLPLSHIAGMSCDILIQLTIGSKLYFARPDAL